ncbi:MAG: class I SAM-dependent RNA methyltransferase [Candidatus Aureabacteria bacterium]|nr:class I SAM-dependent RNA methyltransferase [Candidatus Auribacterota bacterium]
MDKITLIVTTTFGFEAVVKKELVYLGFKDFIISDGKIEFDGSITDIPKLNLWLRAADRVLIKIGEFKAADFDALFDNTYALPWDNWIPEDGKIIVIGKSVKSTLRSVRSNQGMVKKAIINKLKEKYNKVLFPETGSEYTVQVSILKDIAQMTLDTSGLGLHKRNYRVDTGEVPIRENLAAGMVLLSFWNKDKILIDPMCGSGTILIEAAMIARNIAPGLRRKFVSETWPIIDKKIWEEARLIATNAAKPTGDLKIFGYDINKSRINGCKINAKYAGVENDIVFREQDVKDLKIEDESGMVISNPPYGVKMCNEQELHSIYNAINAIFKNKPGWSIYMITSDKKFPNFFRRSKPNKTRKLYNGTIEANYYQYFGKKVS